MKYLSIALGVVVVALVVLLLWTNMGSENESSQETSKKKHKDNPSGVEKVNPVSGKYAEANVPDFILNLGITESEVYQTIDKTSETHRFKKINHKEELVYHIFKGNWVYKDAQDSTLVFNEGELVGIFIRFPYSENIYQNLKDKLDDMKVLASNESRFASTEGNRNCLLRTEGRLLLYSIMHKDIYDKISGY